MTFDGSQTFWWVHVGGVMSTNHKLWLLRFIFINTVDGREIHATHHPRNPRTIRFSCKYQQTIVSTMVS